jgi:uncharacterized membrane protein YphA (DoxX/SURF4 family)
MIALLRFLTGGLFIFSGLIKANDPLGFGYKLEEYFVVFGMGFLNPLATGLAIAICVLEVVLGMALWVGWKTKAVTWWLLGLVVFFTFLTFWSAWFKVVTDCGCFGDFMKLTPWQSFSKDVVLLAMITVLCYQRTRIRPLGPAILGTSMVGLTAIGVTALSFYTWNDLPLLDFRPYAVGKNLPQGMAIPEGAPRDVYKDVWQYRINGVVSRFATEDSPWDSLQADGRPSEFVDRQTELVTKGYVPPIHDFVVSDLNGNDYTGDFLGAEHAVFIVSPFLEKARGDAWIKVAALVDWARRNDIKIAILTGSGREEIESFGKRFAADSWPFYQADGTVLKTMMRSNPGLVLLNKGTVLDLIPARRLPSPDELGRRIGSLR